VQAKRSAADGVKGAIERLLMQQVEELAGVADEPLFVSLVLDATCAQMPHDENEGKRDRRRFKAQRALEALIAAGRLRIENGKVGLV
jgi:hypothetical protein